MSLNTDFLEELASQVNDEFVSLDYIGGGDINEARKLTGKKHSYFLKFNHGQHALDMFEKEARGLKLLASSNKIRTPKVLTWGEAEDFAYLLLEFIPDGRKSDAFWTSFGEDLAKLHDESVDNYGLDYPNYIGRLHQPNTKHTDWIEFFVEERLQPQIELAEEKARMEVSEHRLFDRLIDRLPHLLVAERPALLHGDLWSGNFLACNNGVAVLVDPAVYYGHREADLAMTRLFGGFDPVFYEAYVATKPLASGWEDRLEIYQLYYLLVHVNLFGRSYMSGIIRTLKKYT